MEPAKKRLIGGSCMLAGVAFCTAIPGVQGGLRASDIHALSLMYINSAPQALITPVRFNAYSDAAPAGETAPAVFTSVTAREASFAEYVGLHRTRIEAQP